MVSERGRLEEELARSIFQQILAGVKFMHDRSILHRDLKCENILLKSGDLTSAASVKLIDFGVARVVANSCAQSCVGTLEIMAPEIVCAKLMLPPAGAALKARGPLTFAAPQAASPGFGLATARPDGKGALITGVAAGGQAEAQGVLEGWALAKINETDVTEMPFLPDPESPQASSIVGTLQGLTEAFTLYFRELPKREFTAAADVWSLGTVLYTMLAGKVPFSSEQEIMAGSYSEDRIAHVSADARDLLERILRLDPAQRATILEIEAHPWCRSSS
ncbi:unnamed protein product [Polarella glacialis]|uniref:Protein kinase domain-containing protein n=1 Tax=Polarella glacialis TaxID=89957 RepID=A0A813KR95_POLGL|nr:unnamed protein product [Polarella glacialis]